MVFPDKSDAGVALGFLNRNLRLKIRERVSSAVDSTLEILIRRIPAYFLSPEVNILGYDEERILGTGRVSKGVHLSGCGNLKGLSKRKHNTQNNQRKNDNTQDPCNPVVHASNIVLSYRKRTEEYTEQQNTRRYSDKNTPM